VAVHHGKASVGGSVAVAEESLPGPELNFVFRMEKLARALGEPALLSEAADCVCTWQRPRWADIV
jgi:hypothetical protein